MKKMRMMNKNNERNSEGRNEGRKSTIEFLANELTTLEIGRNVLYINGRREMAHNLKIKNEKVSYFCFRWRAFTLYVNVWRRETSSYSTKQGNTKETTKHISIQKYEAHTHTHNITHTHTHTHTHNSTQIWRERIFSKQTVAAVVAAYQRKTERKLY